jgi:predicted AlkP superfamily pyrophosphatase or phosphodiesterase
MTIRRLLLLTLLLGLSAGFTRAAPRLVVVISIDQMRAEYLVRFQEHFGPHGFRLFLERGAWMGSAEYTHAATSTGPGHAVISTGSYGWENGIIGNSWYDETSERNAYCVGDGTVDIVGGEGEGRSPRNLIGTTLADELRLATGFRGKVVSLSHKDRSAVLLGGKLAGGSFWWADTQFVTSTYYGRALPRWVEDFNSPSPARKYLGRTWGRSLPSEAYAAQGPDDAPYEEDRAGLGRTFPHQLRGDSTGPVTGALARAVLASPFGLEMLADFALAAVEGESLGTDDIPDMLCVGFSTPDYVGHYFGSQSHEVLDIVVQMDRVLERLVEELERRVGEGRVLFAVTSDHAISPIPEYILSHLPGAEAGRLPVDRLRSAVVDALDASYGKPAGREWIAAFNEGGLYLDQQTIGYRKLNRAEVAGVAAAALLRQPHVAVAVSRERLFGSGALSPTEWRLRRSAHPGRSGDVLIALVPWRVPGNDTAGADHGAATSTDAHVPLLFLGEGIRPGRYFQQSSPADLAPTLAALLGIGFPALREGRVLHEILTSQR